MSSEPRDQMTEGVLERIEHYGLYFSTSFGRALVLIPDISNEKVNLFESFEVGETRQIRLLRYIESKALWKGSIIAT